MTGSKLVRTLLAIALLGTLAGCHRAPAAEKTTTQKLLGQWYDSRTGAAYQFVTDSVLVVPHAQQGGGNAVKFSILPGDKLDIETGNSQHVSVIASLTPDFLDIADPLSGADQFLYRNPGRTAFAHSLEASAQAALKQFYTITALPDVVWVAPKPTGSGADWTSWSASTINAYGTAWDWEKIRRDTSPIRTAGGGNATGYSFTFTRKVPTPAVLASLKADSSIEASAGQRRIDVGYSLSKAQYPAGSLVYLPGGMIYSLGGGFAIGVGLDNKGKSFVPLTHK